MRDLISFCSVVLLTWHLTIAGSPGEVLQLHFPDVTIAAQDGGDFTGESGKDGNIYISAKYGSVYFDGVNISEVIDIISSLPPVWQFHSDVGFVGTFEGGSEINVPLKVLDPDNEKIRFEVVAGDLPHGFNIDSKTSSITGIAPDVDAIFTFTVRAIDPSNMFADAVFRFETFEANQCEKEPCRYRGRCTNTNDKYGYVCTCRDPYGGRNCDSDCRDKPLGVSSPSIIPDAQMSAYLSREESHASLARLGWTNGTGWCGENSNSWLQVDLGKRSKVFAIATEGINSDFYARTFKLMYSVDGITFHDVLNIHDRQYHTFTGSIGQSKESLPRRITARFVRLQPLSYPNGKHPCLRLELYGCSE